MKTLMIGVGNPILSDDGVGIHVARELRRRNLIGVDIEELPASGLELLDLVIGYDKVVIVDAIQTKTGTPGDIYVLDEQAFEKAVHGSSPHGINIPTALAMGRRIVPGQMPKEVVFMAIEVEDVRNVAEVLTPKVAAALPTIVERVEKELR